MSNKTPNKTFIFQADAVVCIDCWGMPVWNTLDFDSHADFTAKHFEAYLNDFLKGFEPALNRYCFDTFISATYKNGGLEQEPGFSPLHKRYKYNCNPEWVMLHDAQMKDIVSMVPKNGKIIVGGGSWGYCSHNRPVGIRNLLREGFRVFTNSHLVFRESEAINYFEEGNHGALPLEYFILDDILWSRCYDEGHYYDHLYEGMIHPGIPTKNT